MKKRVEIPNNANELLALANRVRDKHIADGDASVLKALNWTELQTVIDEAARLQEQIDLLKRTLVESYQQRDLKLQPVVRFLRNSRDILAGTYDTEIKKMGQWGYHVREARSIKVEREPVMLKQTA